MTPTPLSIQVRAQREETVSENWVFILILEATNCVFMGKSLDLSVPRFPPQQNESTGCDP